jgi:hypothetical protein
MERRMCKLQRLSFWSECWEHNYNNLNDSLCEKNTDSR